VKENDLFLSSQILGMDGQKLKEEGLLKAFQRIMCRLYRVAGMEGKWDLHAA